jgi:hypothetical protein
MRLLVLKAFNKATGSWPANALPEYTKAASEALGMMDLGAETDTWQVFQCVTSEQFGARVVCQHLVKQVDFLDP